MCRRRISRKLKPRQRKFSYLKTFFIQSVCLWSSLYLLLCDGICRNVNWSVCLGGLLASTDGREEKVTLCVRCKGNNWCRRALFVYNQCFARWIREHLCQIVTIPSMVLYYHSTCTYITFSYLRAARLYISLKSGLYEFIGSNLSV